MDELLGMLPVELGREVWDEICIGEIVVWAGQPIPMAYAKRWLGENGIGLIIAVAFMSLLLADRMPWSTSRSGRAMNFLFAFLQTVFLFALLIRLGFKAARGVAYVVTDRRAIFYRRGLMGARQIQNFSRESLGSIDRIVRRNGTGDLVFIKRITGSGRFERIVREGFFCVSDPGGVEQHLRKAMQLEWVAVGERARVDLVRQEAIENVRASKSVKSAPGLCADEIDLPISPEAREALISELGEGEKLQWTGQPEPWAYLRQDREDVVIGIMGLAMGLGGLVLMLPCFGLFQLQGGAEVVVPIVGFILICLGLLCVLTPIRVLKEARRRVYLLTDSRAVILQLRSGERAKALSLSASQLVKPRLHARSDGVGNVILHGLEESAKTKQSRRDLVGFIGIAKAASVYQQVLAMVMASVARTGGEPQSRDLGGMRL